MSFQMPLSLLRILITQVKRGQNILKKVCITQQWRKVLQIPRQASSMEVITEEGFSVTRHYLDHTTVVIKIIVFDNSDHRTSHHTTVEVALPSFETNTLIEVIMILLICL